MRLNLSRKVYYLRGNSSQMRFIRVGLMFIIIVCCTKNESSANAGYLSPDSLFIGNEHIISSIEYSINFPKEFILLEDYKSKIPKVENQKILEIAGNTQKNHYCFITELFYENIINDSLVYHDITKNLNEDDFKYGEFNNNKIEFNQLRINYNDKIVFIFWHKTENSSIIKYDYILSLPVNEKDIKAVESSISTIKKVKMKEKK